MRKSLHFIGDSRNPVQTQHITPVVRQKRFRGRLERSGQPVEIADLRGITHAVPSRALGEIVAKFRTDMSEPTAGAPYRRV